MNHKNDNEKKKGWLKWQMWVNTSCDWQLEDSKETVEVDDQRGVDGWTGWNRFFILNELTVLDMCHWKWLNEMINDWDHTIMRKTFIVVINRVKQGFICFPTLSIYCLYHKSFKCGNTFLQTLWSLHLCWSLSCATFLLDFQIFWLFFNCQKVWNQSKCLLVPIQLISSLSSH